MLRRRHAARSPDADLVFPAVLSGGLRDPSNSSADLKDAFTTAGYPWMTSHTLRKTVATLMSKAGLEPLEAADQLGHSRPSMTSDRTSTERSTSRRAGPCSKLSLTDWPVRGRPTTFRPAGPLRRLAGHADCSGRVVDRAGSTPSTDETSQSARISRPDIDQGGPTPWGTPMTESSVKAVDSNPPEWLSPALLAAELNIPIQTIYAWRSRGQGPRGRRIGRHVRYARRDVVAWLEGQ
jgi:hypothetical protein